MAMTVLPVMRCAHGPGIRGSDCEICTEQMTDSDATTTHVDCENTFHTACMDEWANSCMQNGVFVTCPKCRATLGDLTNEDMIAFAYTTLRPRFPEEVMYDYSMGNDFPTPALIELIRTDRQLGSAVVCDYMIRLIQAQGLTPPEIIARRRELKERFLRGTTDQQVMATYRADVWLLSYSFVTDLEIFDQHGIESPRESVVNDFMDDPEQARASLDARMNRIRSELNLDQVVMEAVRDDLVDRVTLEIEALHRAVEEDERRENLLLAGTATG